jgi:RNA recognition motif-containing protein
MRTHAIRRNRILRQLCRDLARTVTEEQIRDVFCRYGEIVKIDIKRDKVPTHLLLSNIVSRCLKLRYE